MAEYAKTGLKKYKRIASAIRIIMIIHNII